MHVFARAIANHEPDCTDDRTQAPPRCAADHRGRTTIVEYAIPSDHLPVGA
jgi:hypothetical protein